MIPKECLSQSVKRKIEEFSKKQINSSDTQSNSSISQHELTQDDILQRRKNTPEHSETNYSSGFSLNSKKTFAELAATKRSETEATHSQRNTRSLCSTSRPTICVCIQWKLYTKCHRNIPLHPLAKEGDSKQTSKQNQLDKSISHESIPVDRLVDSDFQLIRIPPLVLNYLRTHTTTVKHPINNKSTQENTESKRYESSPEEEKQMEVVCDEILVHRMDNSEMLSFDMEDSKETKLVAEFIKKLISLIQKQEQSKKEAHSTDFLSVHADNSSQHQLLLQLYRLYQQVLLVDGPHDEFLTSHASSATKGY